MSATVAEHGHVERTPSPVLEFLRTYVFSLDHKVIGIQFLFSTLFWLVIGKLLFPAEGGQMPPEFYTMLFTMHASISRRSSTPCCLRCTPRS